MASKNIRVVFLGGVGEIGKNMTAIEYGEDIVVIDGGMSFPTIEMPGVDFVVPDFTYLKENAKRVRGIVITHGHEDHIGAMPLILKELNVPVYATKLTLALIEHKLVEQHVQKYTLNTVTYNGKIRLGCMEIEFIKVSHSITGAVALAITTPKGLVFHTGDFKIDFTPVDNVKMDLVRLAQVGERGVLLMLGESTNVEREGYSMSERRVGEALDKIFAANLTRRIIIATFASNVNRLQQIIDLAQKYKRRVAMHGRSMENISEMARKIGELKVKEEFVPINKLKDYPDERLVIICTGSQGEPMSALTRMAAGDSKVKISQNDTIIISSSPIPGNEKMVYNVINNLYRKGAEVIYDALQEVHVSGHACKEELKTMMSLIKPTYFIPVHGEYRHLKQHALLAETMGINPAHIYVPDLGDIVEVSRGGVKKVGQAPAGALLIDGMNIGGDINLVLRDRRHLAEDGIFIPIVVTKHGLVAEEPEIVYRGFSCSDDIEKEAKKIIFSQMNTNLVKPTDDQKVAIRRALKKFLFTRCKQSPMILPIIIEH